jgi:serine protease Do
MFKFGPYPKRCLFGISRVSYFEVNKMSESTFQVRRGSAALLLVIVILAGAAGAALYSFASGQGVLAAEPVRVPMYVARPEQAPASSPAPENSRTGPTPMGFASVVKPVLPAVVNISSSRMVKTQQSMSPFMNDPFFQQFFGNQMQVPRERREEALGSGVIVSPDGYILTNNHVVEGATEIKVYLKDKREFKGRVIGRDPKTDIAVVKIDATGLPTVTLGDSSKLEVGDYVLAIGDPFGIGETVTNGIVSATGRGGLDIENYEDFIQTDAPINPGNSGGALINARGDLVGINTAILSSAGGNEGIGFAIPINMARYVMQQILEHGKVVRGWLGISIQGLTPALGKAFNVPSLNGALVGDVDQKGPSANSLKKGDVIVGLNSQSVTGPNELRLQISEMAPGTVAHLKVLRNGQPQDVSVKLGELPGASPKATSTEQGAPGPMAGVQVEPLTPEIAQELKLPSDTKGVVVDSVEQGSAASDAGLKRGDVIEQVNRKPVTNVNDYQQAVQTAGKKAVVLLVNRDGTTAFVVVQPE